MPTDSYLVKTEAWRLLLWRNCPTQGKRLTDTDFWVFPQHKSWCRPYYLPDRKPTLQLIPSTRREHLINLLEPHSYYGQSMRTTHQRKGPECEKPTMNERVDTDIFSMKDFNVFITLTLFIRNLLENLLL